MQKIKKLSLEIVSKIAAGEVIERPAYAVKELIENAIDAGATVITIHIEQSGLRRIQVIDNGEGMSKEDLQLSFLAHTTSKINDTAELVGIKTLGFRGEALSSIAAISNLTIQSRQRDNASGTVIEIEKGRVEHIGSIGMPPGTIVTVDDLFYPVPARKKFLKSEKTEFRHITDIVLQFVLSYPLIHFQLTHNKKTIFDLPGKKNERERVSLVFGEIVDHFLPVSFSDSYLSILGFIAKPHMALRNNQKQYLFVNNRAVSDRLISLAVKESFGTLLPSSSTPLFHLQLSIPYEAVDVNIHPRKEQVNFINRRLIFDLVKQAVLETLTNNNITYHVETIDTTIRIGETTSLSALTLKDIVLPWNRTDNEKIEKSIPFLQIHQTYILAVTKNGMLLIDQHAAHERILFEQFLQIFEKKKKEKKIYSMPKPYTLPVSLSEKQLIEEHIEIFKELGFLLEDFGKNIFLIRQIPDLFKGRRIEKIIKDMLADLSENAGLKNIDITSKRMLAFLSCRAAVKAGDVLSENQIKKIVDDLEKTKNNETCPHGRPTKIVFPLATLHKYFKRI